jgi:hypothetical protein
MMSLVMQRKQTNQAIEELWQNTFFNRYWRAIGSLLGRGKQVPIGLTVAVVMAANLFLGVGVSTLLKETRFLTFPVILTNLMWATYTFLALLVFLQIHSDLLEFLRLHLIESVKREQQLQELRAWAEEWLGRDFQQVAFSLGFACIAALIGFYAVYQITHFSIGVLLIYFINFFHLGVNVYGLISLIAFVLRFRHWSLNLYVDDPASSPILLQLSQQLRNYLLTYSFWITLFMVLVRLAGALNILAITEFLIFDWIPILSVFFLAHVAFSNMIMRVKHERMGEIQSRIMKLSILDKLNAEITTQIMSLMNYHDRVKGAKNSLIDSQAIVNLLGSLALPAIAALIETYVKVLLR